MKIALNGQNILITNPAGPERFTLNLYKYLAQDRTTNKYTVYLNQEPSQLIKEQLFFNSEHMNFIVIPQRALWTQWHMAWVLISNKYDLYFSPRHTFPILAKPFIKIVVMFHGLEYKTNDEFVSKSLFNIWHPLFIQTIAKLADKIIVPSQATKNAIINEHWFNNDAKIKIIPEGVDENFHYRTAQEVISTVAKYDLNPQKYLLFISTIQPRKNLPTLIKAFAETIKNNPDQNYKLVIVGKLGWNFTESLNAPEKYNIQEKVKFLKWIDQEDLYLLLSGAKGYVNFSKDEGFGLTVLEAMASKIPVAVSDISAHREIGGNSILYADPHNINEISHAIDTILNDRYPNNLLELAEKQAKNYTWNNMAKRFTDEFYSLIH